MSTQAGVVHYSNGQYYMPTAVGQQLSRLSNWQPMSGRLYADPRYFTQIGGPFSNMLTPQVGPARPITPVTPFSWGGQPGGSGQVAGAQPRTGGIPPIPVPQVKQGAPMATNWNAEKIQGLQSGSANSGPFKQVFGGRQP